MAFSADMAGAQAIPSARSEQLNSRVSNLMLTSNGAGKIVSETIDIGALRLVVTAWASV
ncbi:hypothetical protein [Pseudomonas syringae]|uniref:hypothetical protein n=1 Tax=Pseudomonas syringae TaxID=317 RepID=UPI0002FD114F|nr:hypothetical protein [Pseudomonas syringae]